MFMATHDRTVIICNTCREAVLDCDKAPVGGWTKRQIFDAIRAHVCASTAPPDDRVKKMEA